MNVIKTVILIINFVQEKFIEISISLNKKKDKLEIQVFSYKPLDQYIFF